MAYTGDTLRLAGADQEGAVAKFWSYVSADDETTLTGAFYFSDGDRRNMKVGDIVDVIDVTSPKYKRYQVATVTPGSGATIAAPSSIT